MAASSDHLGSLADPRASVSLDSMEGLPPLAPAPAEGSWQARAHARFAGAAPFVPGLVLAALLAAVSRAAADGLATVLPGGGRAVSPILLAIGLGLLVRNSVGLPAAYLPGLRVGTQLVLRLGVALLGLGIGLGAASAVGLVALPVVLVSIATALVLVTWINRALRLPARLGTLVAVGTAICGNSAIVATAPAIGADEEEVSYAVGCVTLFGLIALLGYPWLAHLGFADPQVAGIFLGTAIHDTAQVIGAGMLYAQHYGSPETLDAATVTKLLRNAFIVAVIPAMAVLHRRGGGTAGPRASLKGAVPLFVFGFLALVALRSFGDALFGAEGATWQAGLGVAANVSGFCLVLAMAAVGLGTDLRSLRALGLRPLAVGFAAALSVGAASALMLRVLA